jgi:hypothetical protein
MRSPLPLLALGLGLGVGALFAVAACSGESIGGIGSGNDAGPGVDSSTDTGPGPTPDSSTDAHTSKDGSVCCPIDQQRAGCMHLGGTSENDGASCAMACDFFCSENWRIVKDGNGCDSWTYDVRQPAPGEGPQCNPLDGGPDASPSVDGGNFACGSSTCDSTVQYCDEEDNGATTTYTCRAIPASCAKDRTCTCIEPIESPACSAAPGLPTCFMQDAGVMFGCSH